MTGVRLNGLPAMRAILVMPLLASLPSAVPASDIVAGVVQNATRGQPAAGEEVILIRLDGGIAEARTRTNQQGAFSLSLLHPEKHHLVRVIHQNVSYDRDVSTTRQGSIQVFDASQDVPGLTGTIEILRVGTRGNLLHLSDMYEIENTSAPPVTRTGARTFEVYLPPQAKLSSVLAAGPGNLGEAISAKALSGEPGHYSVSFPIRPGATKFAFNYDMPYTGHAAFQTRHIYPFQQLAVMTPPAMNFSSDSSAFAILATGNANYQSRGIGPIKAGKGPGFEISGMGAIPPVPNQQATDAPHQTFVAPSSPPVGSGRAVPPSLVHVGPYEVKRPLFSQSLFWLGGVSCALLAAYALRQWSRL